MPWRHLLAALGVVLTIAIVGATGCGASATPAACHDDSPRPGTSFVEGGKRCTLPDGRQGFGHGSYGCVDPTICHCTPEAGAATCKQFPDPPGTTGLCVYASCNGSDEQQPCQRMDGSTGICCAGSCVVVSSLDTDPNNCGACGIACAESVTCDATQGRRGCAVCPLGAPTCAVQCRTGYALVGASSQQCAASSCMGRSDGTTCSLGQSAGICCGGRCIDPGTDNANCGGCGIRCCAGRQCSPAVSDTFLQHWTESFHVSAVCL